MPQVQDVQAQAQAVLEMVVVGGAAQAADVSWFINLSGVSS